MQRNTDIVNSKLEIEILQKGFTILDVKHVLIAGNRDWHNQTVTCLVCNEGKASFSLDARHYDISEKQAMILDSEFVISYENVSRNFSGIAIVLSKHFLYSPYFPLSFNLHFEIANCPVINLSTEQLRNLNQLFKIAREKDRENTENGDRTSAFSCQELRFLVLAFCYEIYNLFSHTPDLSQTFKYTQKEELMFRFLDIAKQNVIKERKTTYYANKLNVTPQYLSSVLKELSGQTTNQWIHILIISKAKHLLVNVNMTIQEIANELQFPNQSTFGKLFKKQTGMSPIQFRKKIL